MSLSARKRRKRCSIESSSDDDDLGYSTPFKKGETNMEKSTRSSDRISARKNRSFHMPSREDVWDNILPTKSPDKYYQLKPRKLINNFTKENNLYNYDPIVTSGSESMEDFIDDDIQYAKERKKKKTVHRIKNRRSRVIQESSDSSSSTDSQLDDNTSKRTGKTQDEGHTVINKDTRSMCEIKQKVEEDLHDEANSSSENRDSKIAKSDQQTIENDEFVNRECVDNVVLNNNIKKETCDPQDTSFVNNDIKEERFGIDLPSNVCNSASDNDSNFEDNVKSKRRRRKSKVLESDSEEEHVPNRNESVVHQYPMENQLENQLEDQLEAQFEYEVEDEEAVNINDDSDDNDSFIVDDDCENDIDNNTDTDGEEVLDIIDNDTDPQEGTSTGRKKHVRVKMVQKKKEREELFDKFRAARKRQQAKVKIESNNDKT